MFRILWSKRNESIGSDRTFHCVTSRHSISTFHMTHYGRTAPRDGLYFIFIFVNTFFSSPPNWCRLFIFIFCFGQTHTHAKPIMTFRINSCNHIILTSLSLLCCRRHRRRRCRCCNRHVQDMQ